MGGAHAARILTQGHVTDVVEAVFDGPMLTPQAQEVMGHETVQIKAGKSISDLAPEDARVFVDDRAFQAQHQPRTGPIQEIVIDGQHPEAAPLNAAMAQRDLFTGLKLKLVRRGEKAQTSRGPFGVSRADYP